MRLLMFVGLFVCAVGVMWAVGLLLEPEGVKPKEAVSEQKASDGPSHRGPPGKTPFGK